MNELIPAAIYFGCLVLAGVICSLVIFRDVWQADAAREYCERGRRT